jgi:ankyrin repeat protein
MKAYIELTSSAQNKINTRTETTKQAFEVRKEETSGRKSIKAGQRRLFAENAYYSQGNSSLIDVLIKYGNNPDGVPPLHYAIKCRDEKAIKLLLDHGASPNAQSHVFFELEGIDRTEEGWEGISGMQGPLTAMDFAAAYGTPSIIRMLKEYGADINVTNQELNGLRFSPLFIAIKYNRLENISELISLGADKFYLSRAYDEGSSPIHYAASLGYAKALRILLVGVDLSSPIPQWTNFQVANPSKQPPIFRAILSGNLEAVKILLDAGDNLNATYERRLYFADGTIMIYQHPYLLDLTSLEQYPNCLNKPELFKFLIDHGLNINMKSFYGHTFLGLLINTYECIYTNSDLYQTQLSSLRMIIEYSLQHGADLSTYMNDPSRNQQHPKEIEDLIKKYSKKDV